MKAIALRSVYSGLGGAIAIGVLLALSYLSGYPLIMAPFGASCVILFALPEAPLAQPRNVIGGHFVTALTGLVAAHALPFPPGPVVIAIATGLGISFMVLTKTTHPPAGANPLVILLAKSVVPWSFLLFPVVLGAVVLVIVASLYHPVTTRAYSHKYMPNFLKGKEK